MYVLNDRQKRFLIWVLNNGTHADSSVADIVLHQDSYGPKIRITLNEMVETYKSDYSNHITTLLNFC